MPRMADAERIVAGRGHPRRRACGRRGGPGGPGAGHRGVPGQRGRLRAALAWMRSHGELAKVGVEGTGSYGTGLARHLAGRGVEVAEMIRPNRQTRRRRGKSDAADAVAAALAALNGEARGRPKSHNGQRSRSGRFGWPAAAPSKPARRPPTSCAT